MNSSPNQFFEFYDFLLNTIKFWKSILISLIISVLILTGTYYILENTYNISIKIAKLSEAENIINDNILTKQITEYSSDKSNMVSSKVNLSEENRIFDSQKLLQLFIDNLLVGDIATKTANQVDNYSYEYIKNHFTIKEEKGYYLINFVSDDIENGTAIVKRLIEESEKSARQTVLHLLKRKLEVIDKSVEIEKFFFKQKINNTINVLEDNIALAGHLLIEKPVSNELKLRADQLISIGNINSIDSFQLNQSNSFKIPLYLYGSKALKFMKKKMLKKKEEDYKYNKPILSKIRYINYFISLLSDNKIPFVKYDISRIEAKVNKLPFYFFFLSGVILGLLIGLLIAFFKAAQNNKRSIILNN